MFDWLLRVQVRHSAFGKASARLCDLCGMLCSWVRLHVAHLDLGQHTVDAQ
jgi:hypothetical protein